MQGNPVEPVSPTPRRMLRKMPKQSSLGNASTQSPHNQEVPTSPRTFYSSPKQQQRLSLDTLATTEAFEAASLADSPLSAASPRVKHYFSHSQSRPDNSQSIEQGFQSTRQASIANTLPTSLFSNRPRSRESFSASPTIARGTEGLGIPGKSWTSDYVTRRN